MKNIDIYLTSEYDYKFQIGSYAYYLSYKDAVIKRCGTKYNCKHANRALLIAFHEALSKVIEPCIITVHSKYNLGFDHPKRTTNQDLFAKIQNTINKAGHIVIYDTDKDSFNIVNTWEEIYGSGRKKLDTMNNGHKEENKAVHEATYNKSWEDMYKDLLVDSHEKWTPISGGYN